MAYSFHTENNRAFIKSSDIKIYPCAYRSSEYDLESKLNTEANLRRIPGLNRSRIIDWNTSGAFPILKLALDGYYIEINNVYPSDLATYQYADIVLKELEILSDGKSSQFTSSTVLSSLVSESGAEVASLDVDYSGTSYFTGMCFTSTPLTGAISLKLYDASTSDKIDHASILPLVYPGKYKGSVLVGSGAEKTDNSMAENQTIINPDKAATDTTAGKVFIGKAATFSDDQTTILNKLSTNDSAEFKGDVVADKNLKAGSLSVQVSGTIPTVAGNTTFNDNVEVKGTFKADKSVETPELKTTTKATIKELAVNDKLTVGSNITASSSGAIDCQEINAKNNIDTPKIRDASNNEIASFSKPTITINSNYSSLKASSTDFTVKSLTSSGSVKAGNSTLGSSLTLSGSLTGATSITCSGAISGKAITGTSLNLTSGNITNVSSITAAGTITAFRFNATSDARLKSDIEDYRYHDSILDLPVKTYTINGERDIGCLAQDLQKLYPELVSTGEDGYLRIEETKLVYLLLLEVRKLRDRVERLEGERND